MTISLVALDEFKSRLFMLLRIIPHSNDTSFSQKYGWRERLWVHNLLNACVTYQ